MSGYVVISKGAGIPIKALPEPAEVFSALESAAENAKNYWARTAVTRLLEPYSA